MAHAESNTAPPGMTLVHLLHGHEQFITHLAWSPDGHILAASDGTGTLHLWDRASGALLRTIAQPIDRVWSLAWSPDGRLLATGGNDQIIRIWNAATGDLDHHVTHHATEVHGVAWSPDGQWLACGGNDRTIRIWDMTRGILRHTLHDQYPDIRALAWTPDSTGLLTCSSGSAVLLWDVTSGQTYGILSGHTGQVMSLTWIPGTEWLASASRDRTIRIWDVAQQEQRRMLLAQTHLLKSVSCSADGRILASKSQDMVQLWRCDTWQPLAILEEHGRALWSSNLAFHPVLPMLATLGEKDSVIRLWHLDMAQLLGLIPVDLAFSSDSMLVRRAVHDAMWREPPCSLESFLATMPAIAREPLPPTIARRPLTEVWINMIHLEGEGVHALAVDDTPVQAVQHAHLSTATSMRLALPEGGWKRVLAWWQWAARVAPALPLSLAADLGVLFLPPHPDQPASSLTGPDAYSIFLRAVAATPSVRVAHTTTMHDMVIGAILAHLAQHAPIPMCYHIPPGISPERIAALLAHDLTSASHIPPESSAPCAISQELLTHVLERLRDLTPADIRFLHLLAPGMASAADLADLRALTDLLSLPPIDHAVIDDLLSLMPALAETPAELSSQTYMVDGVSGLARRGNLDMVVPSEWAMPTPLLTYRFLNNELLYYGRERPPDHRRTLLLLLIQGGDAMDGDMDVFARACALALARAADAHGTEVQVCWFDRRVSPPQGLTRPRDIAAFLHHHATGGIDLPTVLAGVQAHVRTLIDEYTHIEVQWLLHAQSGIEHLHVVRQMARWLRCHVACRALFFCAGATPTEPPALAEVLAGRWAALGSRVLRDAEERMLAARALQSLARGGSREDLPDEQPAVRRRFAAAPLIRQRLIGATLQRVIPGHEHEILCVAWSPDGTMVASSSHDRTICLWDVADGHLIRTLRGHTRKVLAVAWCPDGKTLASASDDKTVRLWRATDGTLQYTMTGHTKEVRDVAWALDGLTLASASDDDSVRLWRGTDGAHLHHLRGHTLEVSSVAWAPDGLTLASASRDGTIRLWRVWDGSPLQTIEGHGDWVRSVMWAPDGQLLASAADDATVRLWRAWDGALLRTMRSHSDRIWSIAWSPDGQFLASSSGSEDRTIRIWRVADGTMVHILRGHTRCVYRVAWSPDGRMLASASLDQTVRLWKLLYE